MIQTLASSLRCAMRSSSKWCTSDFFFFFLNLKLVGIYSSSNFDYSLAYRDFYCFLFPSEKHKWGLIKLRDKKILVPLLLPVVYIRLLLMNFVLKTNIGLYSMYHLLIRFKLKPYESKHACKPTYHFNYHIWF